MKVGIIGSGAWGAALAISSADAGNTITGWSYDGEYHKFGDKKLPNNIKITKNMSDLSDTDLWMIVVPSRYFRETIKKIRPFYMGVPIIICTKGIEQGTNNFMSEILNTELPECINFGILSGPQFATEVANAIPTGSTLAGNDIVISAGKIALANLYLETTDDIIGTQICGTGKNAAALIAGFNSVKSRGENESAMLFTRAFNEIANFGVSSGARIETFLGLCGIGDLFLSATSKTSRNFSAGVAIAMGESVLGTTEGINAIIGIIARAKQNNQTTPILSEFAGKMDLL